MKFGWVVNRLKTQDSCHLARVIRPHERMLALGVDSRILDADSPPERLRECDVLLFHRAPQRLREVRDLGIITGIDLADDLLAHSYPVLGVDFLVTDSLPNIRFYLSRNTYYWPHGFPDKTAGGADELPAKTRFVWCGNPENLSTLLGDPLAALEEVGARRDISLRIITNLERQTEKWLGDTPKIEPRNFRIEWLPFTQDTHEAHMKECDVGFFPQAMHLDRWRKKSMYKPSHAASLGLPSISSPTEEVGMNFTHGLNAMLPITSADWVTAVETLCDGDQRRRMRANVLELYRTRFTLDLATQQMLTIARLELARTRTLRFKRLRRWALTTYVCADRAINALQRRISPTASHRGKP